MADIRFYRGLSAAEMAELTRVVTTVTYQRGQVLYGPDTSGDGLFVLDHGRVNIYRLTADGRKLVTATMGPGSIFGMGWLTGAGTGSFAEAAEDSTFCVFTRTDLERLIATHPTLALRVIEALASRLEEAETRLVTLAFRTVAARLAATLLRVAGHGGQDVVGLSHQDLADLVGANRETVTRCLDEFYAKGIVDPRRRRIHILDPVALHGLLED